MTTLANYRTMLTEDLTRDSWNNIWATTVLDRALNKGYIKVQGDLGLGWRYNEARYSFSTSVGTRAYSLPTGCLYVESVEVDGWEIGRISVSEMERMGSLADVGTPNYWWLDSDDKINLWPVANVVSTVVMVYRKSLAEMTSWVNSAVSTIFDSAIVAYWAYTLYLGIDGNKAKMARTAYEEYINDLRSLVLMDGVHRFRLGRGVSVGERSIGANE